MSLIQLRVASATVTSVNYIPSNAWITRVDIDCTQGPNDGENYPSGTIMQIGAPGGLADAIYVAGSGGTLSPTGFQSVPLNNEPIDSNSHQVQVSFRNGAPASGGCIVNVFYEVPLV